LLTEYENLEFSNSFLDELRSDFKMFNAVLNYLNKLQQISSRGNDKAILKFLNNFPEDQESKINSIYKNLSPLLSNDLKIITISNSTTILNILSIIHKKNRISKLFICESRPQFEGRILAKELAEFHIAVELIVEAKVPDYVKMADISLVGADQISTDGNIVNKIGTKMLAICCRYFDTPLYVLADSDKISDLLQKQENEKSRDEIWNSAPENIKISNLYFEIIEKELLTEVITN